MGKEWETLRSERHKQEEMFEGVQARALMQNLIDIASNPEKPTAFKEVYSTLKRADLVKWLLHADEPDSDEGVAKQFLPYKDLAANPPLRLESDSLHVRLDLCVDSFCAFRKSCGS